MDILIRKAYINYFVICVIKRGRENMQEYLSSTQASAILSVSKRTLFNWRKQGRVTEYCVPGTKRIFYKYDELIALFEKKEK